MLVSPRSVHQTLVSNRVDRYQGRGTARGVPGRESIRLRIQALIQGVSVRRVRTVLAFLALTASASTLPAFGQTSANGSIRGYVRDATGAVLPDTTITAAGPAAPVPFTVSSDKDGYYRLLELPPGEYELTAERQGFARFLRPGIVTRAGLNLSVDIDLAVGTRAETTTVRAETPMLESSSASQAINVDGELQRDVPLSARRDWADSLLLVPGVVATVQPGSNKVF